MKKFSYVPALDGVRAVAVGLVFLTHAGLEVLPGGFGVTIFFFLSGFLITSLMRVEFEKTSTIDIVAFYKRRFLRIFPPMYITVSIGFLIALFGLTAEPLHRGPWYPEFFFLQNYHKALPNAGSVPGMGVLWSLCVEEHFYLAFPLIALLFFRRNGLVALRISIVVACVIVLFWRVYQVRYGLTDLSQAVPRTYETTDSRIDSILFGCFLALWRNPCLDEDGFNPSIWVVIGACLLLASTSILKSPELKQTTRYSLQGLALIPIFAWLLRPGTSLVHRFLSHPIVRHIGVISYTFYLCHTVVILFLTRWTHSPGLLLLVGGAVALAYSEAMHFLVERPLVALRHRLSVTS